jgi:hypothetical protein
MTLPTCTVRVSTLPLHWEYPIVWVERICERLLISFCTSPDYISQVYLPNAYVYSYGDIRDMNQGGAHYSLAYRGYDPGTSYHLVDVVRNVF